jgi:hypothetical protein
MGVQGELLQQSVVLLGVHTVCLEDQSIHVGSYKQTGSYFIKTHVSTPGTDNVHGVVHVLTRYSLPPLHCTS